MSGEEPGKQKPRSCRTQELARSSAQENERLKKGRLPDSVRISLRKRGARAIQRRNDRTPDAFAQRYSEGTPSGRVPCRSKWPVTVSGVSHRKGHRASNQKVA
jgi:hypothetical protein